MQGLFKQKPCTPAENVRLMRDRLILLNQDASLRGSEREEKMESQNATLDNMSGNEMEAYKLRIDEVLSQVNEMEQRVHEIENFYSEVNKKRLNNSKASSIVKDKEKGMHISGTKNQQGDAANMELDASKRMQELLRQFGIILRQITQHKWSWPFMEPVDVEGLGLHDYLEVIEKPMDFSTIKKQLEDGSVYKHVREACADVRLVFKNAMKYNDDKHAFHVMAKSMLAKFEEKWLQLLPKVIEEEKKLEEEEAEAQMNALRAKEAAYAKMAKNTSDDLLEMDMQLEELRELVLQNCRKMSVEEKRQLGNGLARLTTEDLAKALDIVAEANPSFLATAQEIDLDIDALSETTLWRLRFFVRDALQAQAKASASTGGNNNRRKRETSDGDALVKTTKKRSKKADGS